MLFLPTTKYLKVAKYKQIFININIYTLMYIHIAIIIKYILFTIKLINFILNIYKFYSGWCIFTLYNVGKKAHMKYI